MRRFYTNQDLQENSTIELCEQSFHHWVKVLRAHIGDTAILFNGLGGQYTATLTEITKKSAIATLSIFSSVNRDNSYKVTLAIVMSKGDRMDYALQKATEMGVHDIQLLTSEHCEVKLKADRVQKKLAGWQSVIISACEQSGLNVVPQLQAPITVKDFAQRASQHLKLVLAPTADGQANFPVHRDDLADNKSIVVLIGSEGGLTHAEISHANKQGFKSWCLGSRILRTETAPVVTLAHFAHAKLLDSL